MKCISITSLICIALLTITCKKHDYCPEPPKGDSTCELVQSVVFAESPPDQGGGSFPQYRKEFNESGQVVKVVAALYSLTLDDSMALQLHYYDNQIYFISETNSADTVLIATFNAAKRLTSIENPHADDNDDQWFEALTDFNYTNGRLSRITRHIRTDFVIDYFTTYDENGNVVRIFSAGDDANAGTFFTYDKSVTATAQFYSDQFGTDFLNNQVYLAEFLGWLPDLMPVNKRTSFKQVFNDEDTTDTEPGYEFNGTTLTDHVYDATGKLVSYKIADGQITFTNYWNCKDKNGPY